MAAIVTGCLGAVGGMVGELIISQFNYLYCFRANITNLENEAEKLNRAQRVVISGEDETWLQKSNEIKREIDGILNEVPNVGSGCFSLGARFSLSKRAEETTDRLKELLDEYRFDTNPISLQRPPASTAIPLGITYEFKSRKKIEEDIMATLRSGDVNMIGICGMGGLGKTTMAKRIWNRALEEHVFEEVVMAVVSQSIDKLKIQLEIGGSLGLNLKDETSHVARVQKLHKRLSGTMRTLVILDDVWETLELEDLGIPLKGCTILLTSRSRDVLSAMNVQKIFGMQLLSEEDSWFLFKEKVGTHADDTVLNSIAKEVMNECGRLPIALITVGSALKDKVNVSAWKSALRQLKRRDPDIPDFIKKVYNPLKLSYDALESKYKSVILLCCLYPEDDDIPLELLTYFCMGLRIFEGGMVEERDRMHSLTDVLKDRSLLLDSKYGDDYVRMHDVVRDVCIFIAKQEIKFDGIGDLYEYCSLTSLPFTQKQNNLIHGLFCPEEVSFGCLKKLDIDRNSFSELEELKIFGCQSILSLFTSSMTGNLANLKELTIGDCDEMVEVIKDDDEKGMSGGGQTALLFPKLHTLRLMYLPKLVPFNSLKELSIHYNENPLNCYQIRESVSDRLEVLKINEYKGAMSLFSCSIIGNFVNLTELIIKWCHEMVTVIEDREEEKEKVMSRAQMTLLFPKLQKLELSRLPKLVRFCVWKCDVELPSLTEVVISYCHNMKSFTLGPLNTPKLESVEINDEEFGGVKDLNGLVQQQYINRTEEEQAEEAEKKKGGEEE